MKRKRSICRLLNCSAESRRECYGTGCEAYYEVADYIDAWKFESDVDSGGKE